MHYLTLRDLAAVIAVHVVVLLCVLAVDEFLAVETRRESPPPEIAIDRGRYRMHVHYLDFDEK